MFLRRVFPLKEGVGGNMKTFVAFLLMLTLGLFSLGCTGAATDPAPDPATDPVIDPADPAVTPDDPAAPAADPDSPVIPEDTTGEGDAGF